MKLEDKELKSVLESYSQMDLARRGPFRAIHVVCIIIFSLKNLMDKLQQEVSEDENVRQLMQMGFSAGFAVMGRFVERCLKASSLNHGPLLPSVLVFVEWFSSVLDAAEVCATDQKCRRAISYFFDVFVELLNKLNDNRKETKKLHDSVPLWEDFELRGFVPIACAHLSLDFCGNWEHRENFESGMELRAERIKKAAMKIASGSNTSQKWLTYDDFGRRFCVARSDESHGKEKSELGESDSNSTRGEEANQKTSKESDEQCKKLTEDNPSSSIVNGKPSAVEEEEVILFRPLARYNSAPLSPSISADEHISHKENDDQNLQSDDCLRRATSLLMAQNPAQTQSDPWEYNGSSLKFRSDESSKQLETSSMESNAHTYLEAPISAGPPSLNAWVLDEGSLSNSRRNGEKGLMEHRLEPIEEIASSSLAGLSIDKNESSVISSVNESSNFNVSSTTYSLPIPSAPFLPDNVAWFTDAQAQPSLSAPKFSENSPPITGYPDWSPSYGPPGYDPRYPVFISGYPPPGRMTSSEWLRWYRENHKPEKTNNYTQPMYTNTPGPGNHGNFLYHDNTYRFDQFDRYGNSLSYNNPYTYIESPGPPPLQPGFLGAAEYKASVYNNYQRPVPFGCGAATELRNEPQSLLESLKEKEWRLQRDSNLRGPAFTGNLN